MGSELILIPPTRWIKPDVNATRSKIGTDEMREVLDCTVRLVTPERIVFAHPLAGPSRRFAAYLVDQVIVLACTLAILMVSMLISLGSAAGLGPFFVAYFVLTWGYGAFCEGIFNGQTLGKSAMGIRVISERGVPITGAQAVIRNLIGTVDGLIPFFFLMAVASMFVSRKFQRLGDLAAGTIVIVEQRRWQRALTKVDDPEVVNLLDWLPSRIAPPGSHTRLVRLCRSARPVRTPPPRRDGQTARGATPKAVWFARKV